MCSTSALKNTCLCAGEAAVSHGPWDPPAACPPGTAVSEPRKFATGTARLALSQRFVWQSRCLSAWPSRVFWLLAPCDVASMMSTQKDFSEALHCRDSLKGKIMIAFMAFGFFSLRPLGHSL